MTKTGLGTVSSQMKSGGNNSAREEGFRNNNNDDFRIEDHNVTRVRPQDRDYRTHDDFHSFYSHDHHGFGWRVESLPPRYERCTYFGVDYFHHNHVYYRPYRDHYVVCRPPFGVVIARTISDIAFASVNFAYYNNLYRTYNAIDDNNRYIDQQNRIIAQNNATIAAQNAAIALNGNKALSAATIANQLGLVQSYAYADRNYYYEDGVFYIINTSGQYTVIVPPAGALVISLPEDYDTLTLNGIEYYRVDDTVYRTTLLDGVPYLEVLGQMYGSMARQYNDYYNY